jgi:hypothetical protein
MPVGKALYDLLKYFEKLIFLGIVGSLDRAKLLL